ncbi:hypothetical protein BH09BAC1_BH09BAC1_00330 [soil metagenome]
MGIANRLFMIEIMETVSPQTVAVSARGTVTIEEFQKVSPLILGKVAAFGKVPMILSLKDINVSASKDAWAGIRKQLQGQMEHFSRLAIVVDSLKFKLMVNMAKPFIPIEVKIFDEGEEQDALKWVLG